MQKKRKKEKEKVGDEARGQVGMSVGRPGSLESLWRGQGQSGTASGPAQAYKGYLDPCRNRNGEPIRVRVTCWSASAKATGSSSPAFAISFITHHHLCHSLCTTLVCQLLWYRSVTYSLAHSFTLASTVCNS